MGKQSGIYRIVNTVNGKCYVGSAKSLPNRAAVHRMHLRRGEHHCPHLQAAWSKYGEHVFSFDTLLVCAPSTLIMYEQIAMDTLRPAYNVCKVAGSRLGHKASAETRIKLSEARRGKRLTDEHKKNVSRGLVGHVVSEESRTKMAAAKVGKPGPRLGMNNTPEARAKMSASLKGRVSPMAKRVHIADTIYPSVKAAAEALGVKSTTLGAMLRGENTNRLFARYAE